MKHLSKGMKAESAEMAKTSDEPLDKKIMRK
jgi:hypothetical protein